MPFAICCHNYGAYLFIKFSEHNFLPVCLKGNCLSGLRVGNFLFHHHCGSIQFNVEKIYAYIIPEKQITLIC